MRGIRFITLSLCLVVLLSIGGASASQARLDVGSGGAELVASVIPDTGSQPTGPAAIAPVPRPAVAARPAQFDSGSDGANGSFPPAAVPGGTTAITLDLNDGVVTFLPDGTTATIPNTPAGGFSDGILRFTTVDVPPGVTMTFVRNQANTPVTILAQEDVIVDGTIDVSGADGGTATNLSNFGGPGGPGGFKGGNGEILRSSPGAGSGLGPGGGNGGGITTNASKGGDGGGFGNRGVGSVFATLGGSLYGSHTLLPLVGGSGGGGGATVQEGTPGSAGGGGGGGGGAILIATGGNIVVPGSILAKGGAGGGFGAGGGSGGGIRLVAEAISGTGSLSTLGGVGGAGTFDASFGGAGGGGRIRLEANSFSFTGTIDQSGTLSNSRPGLVLIPNPATVRIASVGGTAVPANPNGFNGGVDLVVASPGTLTILIEASRVPLGTSVAVTAKPETDGAFIGPLTSPALAGTVESSTATVDITFPVAGVYFLEAVATFTALGP